MVIECLEANKLVSQFHVSGLGLTHFWGDAYQDISHKTAEMEKYDSYGGEPENLAIVHGIKRPIAMHYTGTDKAHFLEKPTLSADTVI